MSQARRAAAALLAGAILAGACTSPGDDDPEAPSASVATTSEAAVSSTVVVPDAETLAAGPVAPVARNPLASQPIYFVMTDRFANGDPTNDRGDAELAAGGDPLVHGFLPTDPGFYHGGDLTGLADALPYLTDLGVGAIWITPPFTNRAVQGDGTIDGSSAGYHGYWQIDWSRVDPHLGTEAEMQRLITEAHGVGIAVYFDIVVNHTGDVIKLADRSGRVVSPVYVSKKQAPYLDAEGVAFDDAAVAGADAFPVLDVQTSFPYVPIFETDSDATIKWPDWLNDLTNYHNRGDSLFNGENSLYGDFFGLDDLFTEKPDVVAGMVELYAALLDRYDIDGVRVDTAKHVNDEFWAEFVPALRAAAAERGRPDFMVFGEVFSEDPILNSVYSTQLGMTGTLDFVLAGALQGFVARGGDAATLAQAFDADDWYLDVDSNASMLATFFGNHDIGRMGRLIADVRGDPGPSAVDDELLESMRLGFDLLYLSRGTPVVYYGDEQGFVGAGRDQQARQSMFPSVTPDYITPGRPGVATIGSDRTAADDNFDPTHPLYAWLADLTQLRSNHPALATGAQTVLGAEGSVIVWSRIEAGERVEYLVVANSGEADGTIGVQAATVNAEFVPLRDPSAPSVRSDEAGLIELAVPARSAVIYQASRAVAVPSGPTTIELVRPSDDSNIPTERYRFEAALGDQRPASVTFAVSIDGAEPVVVGTDDAAPYRIYWNNGTTVHGPAVPTGAAIEIIATVDDSSGQLRSDSVFATLTKP